MIKIYESNIDLDSIPEENKHGNCYVASLNKFMENPRKYKLVHGIVTGQGAIEGIQYGHAWVEYGDKAIDCSANVEMPKDVYYLLGNIEYTHEYDGQEVLKMLDKFGTYGPWDKKIMQYP